MESKYEADIALICFSEWVWGTAYSLPTRLGSHWQRVAGFSVQLLHTSKDAAGSWQESIESTTTCLGNCLWSCTQLVMARVIHIPTSGIRSAQIHL